MSCDGAIAEETRDMEEDRNDQIIGESSVSSAFVIPRQAKGKRADQTNVRQTRGRT